MAVFKKLFRRKNIANESYDTKDDFVYRNIEKDSASRSAINIALDVSVLSSSRKLSPKILCPILTPSAFHTN